jgi:hypothetical protein
MFTRIPNELLSCIFALSCTDGRRTASALCLVSGHIQVLAVQHRFRTPASDWHMSNKMIYTRRLWFCIMDLKADIMRAFP